MKITKEIFEELRMLHREAQHSYLTYISIVMPKTSDFTNDNEANIFYYKLLYKWPDIADAYIDALEYQHKEGHPHDKLDIVKKDLSIVIEQPLNFIWSSITERIEPFNFKEVIEIKIKVENGLSMYSDAVDKKNILIDGINEVCDILKLKLGIQYPKLQRLEYESNSLY